MAANELTLREKIDENFLVCGICSEWYKNAKNLPCLHSFCEQCLCQLIKKTGKLECPICRRLYEVPEEGVSSIPTNVFVNELVEEFRKRDGGSPKAGMCGGCEEAESVKHCVECDIDFCRICSNSHGRIRTCRSHQLLTLAEYHSAKFADPTSVQPATYCTSHEDHQIEFHCDTCGTLICLKCTALGHRSHDYRCVKDASREYCKELAKMIEKIKSKEKEASVSKSGVQTMTESLDDTSKKVEEKVKTHIQKTREELLRMVDEDGEKLLKELKDEHDKRNVNLTSQFKELELTENDLSSAREYAENLMQYGTAAHVMRARKSVSTQMEELLKIETNVEPIDNDTLEFDPCADFCKEKTLGVIRKESATYRITKTPVFVRVGDEITVTMVKEGIHRDAVDISLVEATVKTPDGTTEKVEVSDKRDKTVTLKYRARTEGEHELSVTVCKQPVEGSPVRIKVIRKKGLVCKLGEKGSGVGQLKEPCGVTITNTGDVLVCDYDNARLKVFALGGRYKNQYTFPGRPNAVQPRDVTVSQDGKVFFSETGNNQVIGCDENGKTIRCFGKLEVTESRGVAIHPLTRNVYVVDCSGHCVHIYNQDGTYIKTFGCNGSGRGQFKWPEYVAIDYTGKVYVSDSYNHRIQVFDGDGQFMYAFGSCGSGDGQLDDPYGVAVDKHSNVYVADGGNKRIVKFDSRGQFVGRIDGSQDGLHSPRGICVTDDGPLCKVIVADCHNNCVYVFAQ